jgi:hypothetical protein
MGPVWDLLVGVVRGMLVVLAARGWEAGQGAGVEPRRLTVWVRRVVMGIRMDLMPPQHLTDAAEVGQAAR